jgi:pimeloyl-ACP methyl ester carboxylesterase
MDLTQDENALAYGWKADSYEFESLALTSGRRFRNGQPEVMLGDLLAGAAGNGGRHVLDRIKNEVGKMPREVWPIVASHWSRPGYYAGMFRHVDAIPETVKEMQKADPIHAIPVLVLTPGKSTPLSDGDLDRIGDNVRQVIAPASAHWIHLDEPDLVIDSIRRMVTAARGESVAVTV